MTTILAFSPHLDDAVFSAGGALALASQGGAHAIVATLFTGNTAHPQGFALACQTTKGIPPETDYMAIRREEDRAACTILGVEAWHCALLEAPHRGYGSPAALFCPPHACEDMAPLRTVIGQVIAEAKPDIIWAPRAVGGHVDHVLVHRALLSLSHDTQIVWFTDFPYAANPDAPDGETPKLGRVDWLRIELSTQARQRKAEACAAYTSQLGYQFGGPEPMRQRVLSQKTELFARTGS